jgi:hypothetical protein
MTQIAEHPIRTNQTWKQDREGATATTTMEYVDPTKIDATLRELKEPRLLAKQIFAMSTASLGFTTLIEIIFSWPLPQQPSDPEPTSSLGKEFVAEVGERAPEWLRKTEEALRSLLALPANWDSYGARAIELHAVHAAIELLRSIVQHGTPQPVVVPTNRGSIQIEWHTRGIDLEIEITVHGEVRVFYENSYENAETEFELGSNLNPLANLIAKVSRPR